MAPWKVSSAKMGCGEFNETNDRELPHPPPTLTGQQDRKLMRLKLRGTISTNNIGRVPIQWTETLI